jgi:hypothetical protein
MKPWRRTVTWQQSGPLPIEAVYSYRDDSVRIVFDQLLEPGTQLPGSIRFLIDDVVKEPTTIETNDNYLVASDPITIGTLVEPNSVTYAPPPHAIKSLTGTPAQRFERFPLQTE